MLDTTLRPMKDRVVAPLARALAPRVPPPVITGASLVAGVGAAVTAGFGLYWIALALWWTSRVADGLDGAVARQRGTSSDLGGYLDQLSDTVVYAAIPLGIAFAVDDRATWIACAVLLATFFLNTVSWAYLAALIEKRARAHTAPVTSIVMPAGLIEGTETIVLYSLMLAVPTWQPGWMWLMAALVAVTIAQRVLNSPRSIGPG
jgi:phosphatidylglycerophosphate synthase